MIQAKQIHEEEEKWSHLPPLDPNPKQVQEYEYPFFLDYTPNTFPHPVFPNWPKWFEDYSLYSALGFSANPSVSMPEISTQQEEASFDPGGLRVPYPTRICP